MWYISVLQVLFCCNRFCFRSCYVLPRLQQKAFRFIRVICIVKCPCYRNRGLTTATPICARKLSSWRMHLDVSASAYLDLLGTSCDALSYTFLNAAAPVSAKLNHIHSMHWYLHPLAYITLHSTKLRFFDVTLQLQHNTSNHTLLSGTAFIRPCCCDSYCTASEWRYI